MPLSGGHLPTIVWLQLDHLLPKEGPRHRALICAATDLDCVVVTPAVILDAGAAVVGLAADTELQFRCNGTIVNTH